MKLKHRIGMGFILIIVLLSACSPAVITTVQPTRSPQPTITPTVITMDQNVEAFLRGEFDDVSNLGLEERKEFSIILAQKMNEARGARPLIYNNEAYVDPATGMMKDYDGHPDLGETIQMYLAASLDSEGNLLIQNEEGTWEEINGSKDVDWNMVVTDPNDPRIDWPTIKHESGLSTPQTAIANGSKFMPIVLLDSEVNQLYMSGENALMQPTITLLIIETDSSGAPILARKMIAWSTYFELFKEGSDFFTSQNIADSWGDGFAETKKNSPLFKNLKDNQLYYATINYNQPRAYDGAKLTYIDGDYVNVVSVSDAFQVLDNQKSDSINMLVIKLGVLIEPD